MVKVALVPCAAYEDAETAVKAAVDLIGGMDAFFKKGEKILLKPNLLAKATADAACTTHPAVFTAAAKLLLAGGHTDLSYGDSPGFGDPYKIAKSCGIADAADALGIRLADFTAGQTVEFPEGRHAQKFILANGVLECDAILNLCKMKTHMLERITGAQKNIFGCVYGLNKGASHVKYPSATLFAEMLADLNLLLKPRLHVMDAVVAMEGNGPTAGTPKPLGLVLAGKNPHSIDLICAGLIGLDPATVPTLCAAQARGLCPENADGVSVSDDWMPYISPDFQIITERNGLQFQNFFRGKAGTMFSGFLRRYIAARPGVEKTACVGCRKCEQVCPAKAIRMSNGTPRIDRSACIRCFCCQEFCPKGAMRVQRSALARLLVRG